MPLLAHARVRPFSNLYGLDAVPVELDELSSGVPSFLKSDNGKLIRIAILYLVMCIVGVTWVSHVHYPASTRRVQLQLDESTIQCTQLLVVIT